MQRLSLVPTLFVVGKIALSDSAVPVKAPHLADAIGASIPALKRLLQNLDAIGIEVQHDKSTKYGGYRLASWGILDQNFTLSLVKSWRECEPAELPQLNAVRLVKLLALIELQEARTLGQLARKVSASLATVKRDLAGAAAVGIAIEHCGSMASGHYVINEWGVFDKAKLIDHFVQGHH